MDAFLFYLFGGVAVLASLLVVGQRHPMYSVLLLILSFMAVTQIIIYAGAIMVLFLFVVMLLNVPREDPELRDPARLFGGVGPRRLGLLLAVALVAELVWALSRLGATAFATDPGEISSVRAIGRSLFTDHAFAFEVTSVLILVALVGAIVLARKEA